MASNSTWQYRKADTIEERFGLRDDPGRRKYDRFPVMQEGIGKLKKPKNGLKALGLTSGIGSMLIGAQKQGFQVVGNIEWRDYYRYQIEDYPTTFCHNFPGAWMSRGPLDLPVDLYPGDIDFAAGHPECGRYSNLSFSVPGTQYHETRGKDVSDIPLFLKYVALFKPRFFLMDDLPASFEPFPMKEYIKLLPEYDLFPEWVSNWGYGNIQRNRNRMFIVGALKEEKFAFVPGEFKHEKVLKDIIPDLVDFEEDQIFKNHSTVDLDVRSQRYVNMNFRGHNPSWRDLVQSNYNPRKNIPYVSDKGEDKIRPGTWSPDWDGYCPVLAGGFNPVHPLRRTPLSIRERARIQGFPDDFIFFHDDVGPDRMLWDPYNSDGQRGIKQTGKAMPIQFCEFVSEQVRCHILGKKFKATGKRVMKAQPMVDKAKRDFCEQSGYAAWQDVAEACWLDEDPSFYKPKGKKKKGKKK